MSAFTLFPAVAASDFAATQTSALDVNTTMHSFLRFILPSALGSAAVNYNTLSSVTLQLHVIQSTPSPTSTLPIIHAVNLANQLQPTASELALSGITALLDNGRARWSLLEENAIVITDISSFAIPFLSTFGVHLLQLELSSFGLQPSPSIVQYHSSQPSTPVALRPSLTLTFAPATSALGVSARFGDQSPDVIVVSFDQPTNMAKTTVNAIATAAALCTTLFQSTTLAVLTGSTAPQCVFTDSQTLVVAAGQRAYVSPGRQNQLSFNAGSVASSSSASAAVFVPTTPIIIKPPFSPVQPQPSLIAPLSIASCADLLLDARGSAGLLGRPAWFSWYENSNPIQSGFDMNTWLIPSGTLTAGVTYTFAVSVMNAFNTTASSTATVSVLSSPIPSLSVPIAPFVLRASSLQLSPIVSFPACASAWAAAASWHWAWSAFSVSSASALTPLPSSSFTHSAMSRTLAVSAASLPFGTVLFSVKVAVAGLGTLEQNVTTIVKASPLQALIAGGDRIVSLGVPVVLDASVSLDPDSPNAVGSSTLYSWSWSCQIASPASSSGLGSLFGASPWTFNGTGLSACGLAGVSSVNLNQPQLSLPASAFASLSPGTQLQFSLVFTDSPAPISAFPRVAAASVVLTFQADASPGLPDVSIASPLWIGTSDTLKILGNIVIYLVPAITLCCSECDAGRWQYTKLVGLLVERVA